MVYPTLLDGIKNIIKMINKMENFSIEIICIGYVGFPFVLEFEKKKRLLVLISVKKELSSLILELIRI